MGMSNTQKGRRYLNRSAVVQQAQGTCLSYGWVVMAHLATPCHADALTYIGHTLLAKNILWKPSLMHYHQRYIVTSGKQLSCDAKMMPSCRLYLQMTHMKPRYILCLWAHWTVIKLEITMHSSGVLIPKLWNSGLQGGCKFFSCGNGHSPGTHTSHTSHNTHAIQNLSSLIHCAHVQLDLQAHAVWCPLFRAFILPWINLLCSEYAVGEDHCYSECWDRIWARRNDQVVWEVAEQDQEEKR